MRFKKSFLYLSILTLFLTFNLLSCGGGDDGFIVVPGKSELKVFVTSESGTGDLSSWADAGGETGLAAGDAICQAAAERAGLSGTFRAWLSDTNTDAYCHLHGLTGKKADKCGGTSLPTPYGPWVRMDGFPFGETIDIITNSTGQIYAPVQFDENGVALDEQYIFTDTAETGARDTPYTGSCSDWSSSNAAEFAMMGKTSKTTHGWTTQRGPIIIPSPCDSTGRLLCFQTGKGKALPGHTTAGKLVFITSSEGKGKLGDWTDAWGATGITAGDNICRARAATSPISAVSSKATKFKAWLSNSSTDAINRFAYDGPWVRIDGVKIADNKTDLTDGSLFSSINQDESGNYLGNSYAWTGTLQSGSKIGTTGGFDCNGWTYDNADFADSFFGNGGNANDISPAWTNGIGSGCNGDYHLYCFEDK